jgi:antitoxin component of MazEF toxin-antitoxin module
MRTILTEQQQGDSLIVVIPESISAKMKLVNGQRVYVDISKDEGSGRRSHYRLADLLKSCRGEPHPANDETL